MSVVQCPKHFLPNRNSIGWNFPIITILCKAREKEDKQYLISSPLCSDVFIGRYAFLISTHKPSSVQINWQTNTYGMASLAWKQPTIWLKQARSGTRKKQGFHKKPLHSGFFLYLLISKNHWYRSCCFGHVSINSSLRLRPTVKYLERGSKRTK